MGECEYEFARKILKREQKNPTPYTQNRRDAMASRVLNDKGLGPKALKELHKEFGKKK